MNTGKAESEMRKPEFPAITLAAARGMDLRGYAIQEKSDGRHEFLTVADSVLNCELMPDGGRVVNDALFVGGRDVRQCGFAERWLELGLWLAKRGGVVPFRLSRTAMPGGDARAFIEAESTRNGPADIVVLKPMAAGFGQGWLKCKHLLPYRCTVAAFCGGSQSVQIVDAITGQARGKVALRGGKCDRVRVGSVLKLVAAGEHASGLLREARPDPEGWLVRW